VIDQLDTVSLALCSSWILSRVGGSRESAMDHSAGNGRCSLEEPKVCSVLARLHRKARAQMRSPSSRLSVGLGRDGFSVLSLDPSTGLATQG